MEEHSNIKRTEIKATMSTLTTQDLISKDNVKGDQLPFTHKDGHHEQPPPGPTASQLSDELTADSPTNLTACCLLRPSETGSGTGSGTGNESGSETVCSEEERVSGSEIWSGT